MAEQVQGRNQHLRSFLIELARSPHPSPTIAAKKPSEKPSPSQSQFADVRVSSATERCRASLFQPDLPPSRAPEGYQKTLRLSRFEGNNRKRRIALAATGMQGTGELVVFNAATDTPNQGDILTRIRLAAGEEVADADVLPVDACRDGSGEGPDVFEVAYTQGAALSTFTLKAERPSPVSLVVPEVAEVYKVPAGGARIRGFRCLCPGSYIVLQNLAQQGGSELLLIVNGHIHDRRRLSRSVKAGLSIDVCQLPASGNGASAGNQYVVAVAGNDYSIALFTIDQRTSTTFSRINPYIRLPNVHTLTIKRVAFSTPNPQATPTLKLASISIGSSLVVHTFPLAIDALPSSAKPSSSPMRFALPGSFSRYQTKDLLYTILTSLLAIILFLLAAIILQIYADSRRGGASSSSDSSGLLPPVWRTWQSLGPRVSAILARPL